eukprot:4774433-Amphidinium_carterae.1
MQFLPDSKAKPFEAPVPVKRCQRDVTKPHPHKFDDPAALPCFRVGENAFMLRGYNASNNSSESEDLRHPPKTKTSLDNFWHYLRPPNGGELLFGTLGSGSGGVGIDLRFPNSGRRWTPRTVQIV